MCERGLRAALLSVMILYAAAFACGYAPSPVSLESVPGWEKVRVSDPGPGHDPEGYRGVSFVDARHGWLAADGPYDYLGIHQRLLSTVDGGKTWTSRDVPVAIVRFLDEKTGWAAGGGLVGTVGTTADGGRTWSFHQMPAGRTVGDLAPLTRMEAWAVSDLGTGRGRLLHTTDGGASWRDVPVPLRGYLSSVYFLDRMHGWVAVDPRAQPGSAFVLRTSDGGRTFRVAPIARGMDWGWKIRFRDRREGWATAAGALAHTTDGGRTWVRTTPGARAVVHDFSFPTRDVGWAVGSVHQRAFVAKTADRGRTWEVVKTGAEGIVYSGISSVVFVDATHGWILGDGGVPPSDTPPREEHQISFMLRHVGQ